MIRIYIPYNNDDLCVYREQAFSVVYNYYSSIKGFKVKILFSSPFSRAAARNAVFEDRLKNSDTVFFSDADIITPEEQVREAVKISANTGGMVLAYTDLSKMNAQKTRDYLSTGVFTKSKKLIKNQCSGSFAIPVKLLKEIGGWDERFTEWGCEDRVFFYLAAFLRDKTHCQRLPGIVYHLFHPLSKNAGKRTLRVNSLYQDYLRAFGISFDTLKSYKEADPEKIQKLVKEAKNHQQNSTKEIIPFQLRTIAKFKKKRKIVLTLTDTELYKTLTQSKEYEYIGAVA
jgi:predicted glycosyltransferase involved in capsule biosynthesis